MHAALCHSSYDAASAFDMLLELERLLEHLFGDQLQNMHSKFAVHAHTHALIAIHSLCARQVHDRIY